MVPIPPTGTSQWPLPPPITWYRKQRFWRRSRAWARLNVPIRASVSTTPRAVSPARRDSISSPSGRSNSADHAASSATWARIASRSRNGSSSVGNTRRATARGGRVQLEPPVGIGAEPRRGRRRVALVDQQPAVADRRVRRDPPAAQLDVDAELVDDRRRQQAHEVAVLREAGVEAGEDRLRPHRATEHRRPLQHDDRAPGVGEVARARRARCARHRSPRRRSGRRRSPR